MIISFSLFFILPFYDNNKDDKIHIGAKRLDGQTYKGLIRRCFAYYMEPSRPKNQFFKNPGNRTTI